MPLNPNQTIKINGIVKREKNGVYLYDFETAEIVVNPVNDSYRVNYRRYSDSFFIAFADILPDDRYGATNAEELVDYFANNDFYSPNRSAAGGGATEAEQQAQTALLTSIDDKTPADPSTVTKQDEIIAAIQAASATNRFLLTPFGRQPVAINQTLFEAKRIINNQPRFYDEEINGSASIANQESAVNLFVGGGAGNYAINQTLQRIPYQSGKGQVIKFTTRKFEPTTDVIKRRGYYSSVEVAPFDSGFDGIFLESSEGEVKAIVANNGSLQTAPQSTWNIDKMDGTGASGQNINWTRRQISVINFQWLAVGAVLIGFDIDREFIPAHVFFHANNNANGFGVYMLRPNQPLRSEIRSLGGSDSLIAICETVESENGVQEIGASNSTRPDQCDDVQCSVAGNSYLLFGIRLKAGVYTSIILKEVEAINQNNDDFFLSVVIDPVLTSGAYNFQDYTESVQISSVPAGTNAPTVDPTSGTYIFNQPSQAQLAAKLPPNKFKIGTKIDGTKQILAVVVTPVTGGADFFGALNWDEYV